LEICNQGGAKTKKGEKEGHTKTNKNCWKEKRLKSVLNMKRHQGGLKKGFTRDSCGKESGVEHDKRKRASEMEKKSTGGKKRRSEGKCAWPRGCHQPSWVVGEKKRKEPHPQQVKGKKGLRDKKEKCEGGSL